MTNKSTQAEKVYDYMLKKIVNCEYFPAQEMTAKEIVDETGFGLTPVREALLLLQQNGVVEILPRKGVRIAPLTEADIKEIYKMRALIEPQICMEYAQFYSRSKLFDYIDKFDADYDRSDYERFQLDVEFHRFLIDIIDNKYLNSLYNTLMPAHVRIGVYEAVHSSTKHIDDNIKQHKDIIDAILKDDKAQIRVSLMYHLNYALAYSINALGNKKSE
ncbi:MAG: GntR family transcriptional regulator [Ruminococcus sp.]|nr:GntR family transcriptional regulator [Ruminococcus sp.]